MIPRFFALLVLLGADLGGRIVTAEPDTGTSTERPASEFRHFTSKRGQRVEARIVSLSEDRRLLNLEGRNGQAYQLPITTLDLDDSNSFAIGSIPSPRKRRAR